MGNAAPVRYGDFRRVEARDYTLLYVAGGLAATLAMVGLVDASWRRPRGGSEVIARVTPTVPFVSAGAPSTILFFDDSAELPPALPLAQLLHTSDRLAYGTTHPYPGAQADFAGRLRPAPAGGRGDVREVYSDRFFRQHAQAHVMTGQRADREFRAKTGERTATPDEALVRRNRPGFDERDSQLRRVARRGNRRGSRGRTQSRGRRRDARARAHRRDDISIAAAPAAIPKREHGDVRSSQRERGASDRGAPSTESWREGKAAERRRVSAASTEPHPLPITMLSPATKRVADAPTSSRDGATQGGARRRGIAPTTSGQGTAMSRAWTQPGDAQAALMTLDDHSYFNELPKRLRVKQPDAVRLELLPCYPVALVRLARSGRIESVRLLKSSGYDSCDRELLRGLRAIRGMPKPPSDLLADRATIAVRFPYAFRVAWR